MPIERVLTAEQFKKESPEDQALYSVADDGTYTFVAERTDDLKSKNVRTSKEADKLIKERDLLQAKLDKYEQSKRDAEHEEKVQSHNVKEANAAWQTKLNKEISAREEKINKLTQTILKQRRDTIINEVAEQIALPESVHLVKLMLRDRVDVTIDERGDTQPVVYDADKKVTRDSIKDLTKEIVKDKRNAHILKAADVGSGATPQTKPQVEAKLNLEDLGKNSAQKMFAEYHGYKALSAKDKMAFLNKYRRSN